MKFFSNLIICALLCIVLGCNNSNNSQSENSNENGITTINLEELIPSIKEELHFDELIDKIKVLKLETVDESLLGQIFKIKFSSNYIYIIDQKGQFKIFDKNGKYVNSLKQGNGPSEYNYILAYTFNEYKKELVIVDYKTIKRFTETGEYISSEPISYSINDIIAYQNGYVLFTNSNVDANMECSIKITDFDFKEIKTTKLYNHPIGMFSNSILNKNDNEILCSLTLHDEMYSIQDTIIQPKYQLQFGQYAYPTKTEAKVNESNGIVEINLDEYLNVPNKFNYNGNYIECNNIQYFLINSEYTAYPIFRNKTGKIISGLYTPTTTGLGNLIFSENSFTKKIEAHILGTNNNYFVSSALSETLIQQDFLTKLTASDQISQTDIETLKSLTEDDNPILVFWQLKEDF
ncbi:MAG: 6-bladed beta-propeller [Bacteroidales bacterium]|nr:6-bladed beta-propeller [Bacteroidales bacterium]